MGGIRLGWGREVWIGWGVSGEGQDGAKWAFDGVAWDGWGWGEVRWDCGYVV